jgi:hypothetical protein
MQWIKPDFQRINMSAEIGSYQEEDGGRYPNVPLRNETLGEGLREQLEHKPGLAENIE